MLVVNTVVFFLAMMPPGVTQVVVWFTSVLAGVAISALFLTAFATRVNVPLAAVLGPSENIVEPRLRRGRNAGQVRSPAPLFDLGLGVFFGYLIRYSIDILR